MTVRDVLKRLLTGLPVAAVAGAVLAAGAPAAAVAADECQARGSRTEEASRYARVYSVRRVQDDTHVRRWYACLYSEDRRVRLGTVGAGGVHLDRISPVRLAGRYVATASEYTAATGDALGAVVEVRDLRTGRLVRHFHSPSEPNTYDVTDLELRANGSVAFIARVLGGMPATTTYEVRALRSTGSSSELLDSGAGIDRRSLALSGSTLYWSNDGLPRAARL